MSRTCVRAYAVFAIAIMVLTVAWFAFSISQAIQRNTVGAQQRFAQVIRRIAPRVTSKRQLTDAEADFIQNLCKNDDLIMALNIFSNRVQLFSWTYDDLMFVAGGGSELVPRSSSLFIKIFSGKVPYQAKDECLLFTAALRVLTPANIFFRGCVVFLVMLTLTISSMVFLVIEYLSVRRFQCAQGDARPRPAGPQGTARSRTDEAQVSPGTPPECQCPSFETHGQDLASKESVSDLEGLHLYNHSDEELFSIHDSVFQEHTGGEGRMSSSSGEEGCGQTLLPVHEKKSTYGLFNPLTGVGWRAYLEERLEAELGRATASEQDLTLMIVQVEHPAHQTAVADAAKKLVEFFKFRDMLFEFEGSCCFAGIVQDASLEEAMVLARDIHKELCGAIESARVLIGIATRTSRLTTAAHLIEEAHASVKRAREDPAHPIIAFEAPHQCGRPYRSSAYRDVPDRSTC
ncbi:GGDEF domain-containing protein [Treponema pallidum]|uniref:GGDEF domain-containing protein n=1 Tax=Treponema pallidum TaxID=160 RepID=UPI00244E7003|nr:diguanylate cyclase [Treponema pallidum]